MPVITVPWLSTLACLVFIAFRKFFFCIMSADFFVSTTEINVMIASLEKISVPQVIIIPLAVLVRFFPTVKEEWNHIRTAMRMRNIGTGAGQILLHPIKAMEYMIVPLLFSTVKIGEELAAAALARGLGMHNKRTNLLSCLIENGRLSCDGMLSDYCVFFEVMWRILKIYGGSSFRKCVISVRW